MTPQPSEQPRTAAGRALLTILRHRAQVATTEPCMAALIGAVDDAVRMLPKIEAEAAAPDPVASPLDVRQLQAALHSTLPGDYDPEAHKGEDEPTCEYLAEYLIAALADLEARELHESRLAAAYALEGQPAADPAVLADQIVDEGRVSAFGPPGTTFTPERQAKGQPVAEEPA